MNMRIGLMWGLVALTLGIAWSQGGLSQGETLASVGERSNPVAQTIVDAMRSATGAELALLGAAFFNESASVPASGFTADDFIKALAHPDDEVVVLSLRGEQILQALERALELYPQKNNAFLQLAGVEVRFNPKAEPGRRIVSVVIGGAKLDPNRTYRVATTAPMARGALGYFRVWSRDQITTSTGRTLADTVREYLKWQRSLLSQPAWVAQ
ncbi:MAG: 5'-nucleotidase C-terminal domain-containing protein [Fimbriimonadales bacterium]|nr:5'-nucleotidase C-terminal domain-containing protein [Fimbriimonadales bacterium]